MRLCLALCSATRGRMDGGLGMETRSGRRRRASGRLIYDGPPDTSVIISRHSTRDVLMDKKSFYPLISPQGQRRQRLNLKSRPRRPQTGR